MLKILIFFTLMFSSKVSFSQNIVIDDIYFEDQRFPYKSQLILSGNFPGCSELTKANIVFDNQIVKVFLESDPFLETSCPEDKVYHHIELDHMISGTHEVRIYIDDVLLYNGDVDFRLFDFDCHLPGGCLNKSYGFSSPKIMREG